MAYNNGFPVTYPQYFPQYQVQQPVMPQQVQQPQQAAQAPQNNGIIWVSGEAGAKAYLVAPNTTVQLWDSESQCIYLKSADASGMPSIKILDYTIRNTAPANAPIAAPVSQRAEDYATKAEVDALYAQIRMLKDELEGLTSKRPVPARKKEVSADE